MARFRRAAKVFPVRIAALLVAVLLASLTASVHAAEATIIKVLPHYLDAEGRHTLAPSLYERDAYQAHLRKNPELRKALRFDINWKSPREFRKTDLVLRLEFLTSNSETGKPTVINTPVKGTGWSGGWTAVSLTPEQFKQAGKIISWRATLWHGELQLAEQRSFLW
jgi:hypothetical protein